MKNVIVTTAVAAVLSVASFAAMAKTSFDPSVDYELAKVCKAIKSGSMLKLNRAVKSSRVRYTAIVEELRCNGMTVIAFAREHDQDATADYLAHRYAFDQSQLVAKSEN